MMLTFLFQIVFKAKPHSKANAATKALKAVTTRQVFAISDKAAKTTTKPTTLIYHKRVHTEAPCKLFQLS